MTNIPEQRSVTVGNTRILDETEGTFVDGWSGPTMCLLFSKATISRWKSKTVLAHDE